MDLKELINKIGDSKFKCNVSGIETHCQILKIDIETGEAFVRLDQNIKQIRTEQVMNEMANDENDYYFKDVEFETDQVWVNY